MPFAVCPPFVGSNVGGAADPLLEAAVEDAAARLLSED